MADPARLCLVTDSRSLSFTTPGAKAPGVFCLMIFCSFFSGPGYDVEARELVKTLDAFGLAHDVRELPDAGGWELNCGRKASYLLQMRADHPGEPLVWVDADARIRRLPTLFEHLDCDFAAHWKDGTELLSGTMYFGPNDAARDLLEAWRDECAANPSEWDQKCLQRLVDGSRRWRVSTLPAEYTAIFDAGMSSEPVIEHMQASRRLRR